MGYIIEYDFVPPPPTDYDIWQRGWFSAAVDDPAQEDTLWGDNADPDRDGLKNILEFIMDLNPLDDDRGLGPRIKMSGGNSTFTYRQTAKTNHDVVSYVSWSHDLERWMTGGLVYNVTAGGDPMEIEANLVTHHEGQVFMRLEALRTGSGTP